MVKQAKIHIKENHISIFMITIIVLGVILRFKGLTFQSYWLDELYSADLSSPENTIGTMLQLILQHDVHPPLYQTLLWISYQAFGYTEFTGRALSVIFSSLGIIAIYYLGKELFNKHVGLYAAFFASINYFLIFYAQEARSYSLLFLLSVLSYIFFIKALNGHSNKNILLYWLSTVALYYTHYFGFFIVASQVFIFIFYIFQFPDQRKKLIVIATFTSIVFILSLLPIIKFIFMNLERETTWIQKPSISFFVSYIYSYFHNGWLLILFAVGGLISTLYLFKGTVTEKAINSLILLLIWITIGYLLPYLRSVLSTPLLTNRNTIIVLPGILLLVGYGIWRLNGWKRIILLSMITFFSFYTLRHYYEQPTKGQYREVLRVIGKHQFVSVYNAIPYGEETLGTNHYQTYANLLHMNIEIGTRKMIIHDFENSDLPRCFWILDAHGEHIKDLKIDTSFHRVYETNYHGANGVLFSSYVDPMICSKKVGIQVH